VNPEILKPIPLTAARKPASFQEHRSYSCALWDHIGFFLESPNEFVIALRIASKIAFCALWLASSHVIMKERSRIGQERV
jgi:hypothetical protein